MPFQKGRQKTGGKTKGSSNKATKDIKEAYQQLIENNLDNLTVWLKQIAAKDPEKAIRIISDLSEYVIPKLARREHTGEDGKELSATILFKDFTNAGRNSKKV